MIRCNKFGENEWVLEDELIDSSLYKKLDDAIDLWHSGQSDKAESLLKEIISINSSYIDAYHHLSIIYEENELDFESYLCCREAVRIGFSAIPEGFSWASSKLEWCHLDNRPFLRAYHNLGLWLERRNEASEAIVVYRNLLAICPSDNIGVRYLLPKLWIEAGDLLSIVRICKEFPDDYSPELMYTHSLALILLGETEKAKIQLENAKSAFPLVSKELKKKRHSKPKSSIQGLVTMGGADQAYEYWKQYGKYWVNSEQAMSLL